MSSIFGSVRFTREDETNRHCEPKARALYDQRMFDWLATAMSPGESRR